MSGRQLNLVFHGPEGAAETSVTVSQAVIAGWTGRDTAAVEKHVKELEALGVKRPATTPIFYRVSASRLTTDDEIETTGEESSGEVEFVMLKWAGKLWLGVGSDHTDRQVETYGVTVSKQMCDKPIGQDFWPFDAVRDHWDKLILRSHTVDGGKRALYQEGPVTAMLDPLDLIGRYTQGKGLPDGTLMFFGTLAAHGGIRPSERLELELHDPVLGRSVKHGYSVTTLPVLG